MTHDGVDLMTDSTLPALPGLDDLGSDGTWKLPRENGGIMSVDGTFLGLSSSRRSEHERFDRATSRTVPAHPGRTYAAERQQCSACRWIEFRIFDDRRTELYVVHRIGASVVPGDRTLIDIRTFTGPAGLVQSFVSPWARNGSRHLFTRVASDALWAAADYDADIERMILKRTGDSSQPRPAGRRATG